MFKVGIWQAQLRLSKTRPSSDSSSIDIDKRKILTRQSRSASLVWLGWGGQAPLLRELNLVGCSCKVGWANED